MRKFIAIALLHFVRFLFRFRYRVTIKGAECLDPSILNKSGGVLFLPNHPTVLVDPTLVAMAIWEKYPVRPMVVEYMYYTPIIHSVMKLMNALPVPDFVASNNTLKRKKADEVIDVVMEDLKKGENFLIYPAGKTKHQGKEIISASGVHKIIQGTPEANIVLVRTTGLWGSRFSRALDGKTPDLFQSFFWGLKVVLKNFIFFTPKRDVLIEFQKAPADFPYHASRLEMNRYLEDWYNQKEGGEEIKLVSYSMWKEEFPVVNPPHKEQEAIDLSLISEEIKQKIRAHLAEITGKKQEEITPELLLADDLGLDSLDIAEVIIYLDDEFEVKGIPVSEMTTVAKTMGLAAKQVVFNPVEETDQPHFKNWFDAREKKQATVAEGDTMIASFLNQCQKLGKKAACADASAGVLTYAECKIRILLLADYIRTLPGEYVGILLPSSVAAYLTALACQLAGKIPIMVNWTVGARHLESVIEISKVQHILSSWVFLDRLENVDLLPLEGKIVMLEDVKREFSLTKKLKALYRSKLSTSSLLRLFGIEKKTKEDTAVVLFTSGTESMPKGVPLSHHNVLSNQRGVIASVNILEDDVLLGILPPFHSFGFTVTGFLPLMAGIRAIYFPNPTDGKAIAGLLGRWKPSLIGGTPAFLRGIFKNASQEQLKTLRFCFTGAEKAPDDLFRFVGEAAGCCLLEGYGITECSPVVTANVTGDPKNGVGAPIEGVELLIVSLEDYQPLKQGEQGMVLVKGPNIFKGYLNPGLTSPFVQIDNQTWYITGDLGFINSAGALILAGRLKRFIKMGGEMLSLAAIEHVLLESFLSEKKEGVPLVVCAKEEAGEKTKLCVFSTFPIKQESINEKLREAGFSNLVKVAKVQLIEEIPLMGSGKVNYRVLESQIPSLNEN